MQHLERLVAEYSADMQQELHVNSKLEIHILDLVVSQNSTPLGNGAKDFPHAFFTTDSSSQRTRLSSASIPQNSGTLPSAPCTTEITQSELV